LYGEHFHVIKLDMFPTSVEMNRMVQDLLASTQVTDERFAHNMRRIVLRMYGLPEDMKYFCGALPCSLMSGDLKYLGEKGVPSGSRPLALAPPSHACFR
jgi:hypothetical protein